MVVPLYSYFMDYIIFGVVIPNRAPARAPPLFPPAIWNVYDRTLRGADRTNNICEGWNHAFNMLVGQRHPPLYMAIDCLQKDYATVKSQIMKSQNGTPLKQRVRNEVRKYNNNVTTLCRQYQNGVYANNIDDYLRRISHNIRF